MIFSGKYAFISTLVVVCYSKDLHLKEERGTLIKDNGADMFQTSDMSHLVKRERFARHVELTVTETVLQHLINEINRKYPETRAGAKNSTMPKLIRRLKSKLRKQIKKNKFMKHKKMNKPKGTTRSLDVTTTENTLIENNNVV